MSLLEAIWEAWTSMLDDIDAGRDDSLTRAATRKLTRWLRAHGQDANIKHALTYHPIAKRALDSGL